MSLFIKNARVLTLAKGGRPRRGEAARELSVLERVDVFTAGPQIAVVGNDLTYPPDVKVIDANGRVLMPGFVDCHTHLCYAGSRIDEWEQKLGGKAYLEILAAGGGIMSTVRATRAATEKELEDLLVARLMRVLREGTTTVEVKSGYGLSTEHELKMLRAIAAAAKRWPGTVVATALLGHALDPDVPREAFVKRTIEETLPAVHAEFPAIAIDAFCETGAWSVEECERLFTRAMELGHPVRVHADQFNSLGMVGRAVELRARSVDHLEASTPEDLRVLGGAHATAGVVLPVCGFHLDGRYANARTLMDANGFVALATNSNPGSAPTMSMPFAMGLAVRHCGLTAAEAITCATTNAAAVLGMGDRGVIATGKRADLLLLKHTDERSLVFEVGSSHIDHVIVGGRVV